MALLTTYILFFACLFLLPIQEYSPALTTMSTPSQYLPATLEPPAETDYDEGEEEYEDYPDQNNYQATSSAGKK
jgi:hypothetical protein